MTDEARLHDLLDLVEQARSEGDTATEAKAAAAYKRESVPQMSDADIKSVASRATTGAALQLVGLPAIDTLIDTAEAVKQWPGVAGNALKQWGKSVSINPLTNAKTSLAGMANIAGGMLQQPVNLLSKDASNPAFTIPQFEAGKPVSDLMGAAMHPLGGAIGGAGKDIGQLTGIDPHRVEAGINTALLAAPFMKGKAKATATKPAIPTKEQLATDSKTAYKAAEDAGIEVSEPSFASAKTGLIDALNKEGVDPTLHPKTTAALKRIAETEGPVTLQKLETLRKISKDAESSIEPADRRLAGQVVDHIDDYIERLDTTDVVSGDPAKAALLKDARNLWSRKRKADVIDELMHRAELSAPNFSASGMENAIRTEFRSLAKNQRKMRGFTKEEQAAIERVAKGGPVENSLRMLGKAAPTGVVSGALSSGAGLAFGGPIGAVALPLAGMLARSGAKKMTLNNAMAAQELMRRGPVRANEAPSVAQAPAQPILSLPSPQMIGDSAGNLGTAIARADIGLTPDILRSMTQHPGRPQISQPMPPLALPLLKTPEAQPMVVDQAGRTASSQADLNAYLRDTGLLGANRASQPRVGPQPRGLLAETSELETLMNEAQSKGLFESTHPSPKQAAIEREWMKRFNAAKAKQSLGE